MKLARGILQLLACIGLFAAGPASALDPARSIRQYKHTSWTIDDGVPSSILSLAHGADGYLWIGSQNGLYRFDGVTFESIEQERPIRDRANVTALLASRDGTVWAGYAAGGVARYSGGVLRDASLPHPDSYVVALVETVDGSVWARFGRADRQLARYRQGHWEEVGANWGLPGEPLLGMLAARDGSLWVTTKDSVLVLKRGVRHFEKTATIPVGPGALSQDSAGRIWLTDQAGTRTIAGAPARRIAYPSPPPQRTIRTLFDRDGALWGITGRVGLFRIRTQAMDEPSAAAAAARVDLFQQKDGLTADGAGAIIEDREGNIWVGTGVGLDRFRPANVVVEPLLTNLPTWGDVLLGASDGSVYVGEADRVYRVAPGGHPEPVLTDAGESEAMCEGRDGAIWMIMQHRIARFQGGTFSSLAKPPTGLAITDCAIDGHGALWLTAEEGLYRRTGAGWRFFPMPPNDAMPIIATRDGRLLVSHSAQSLRWIDFPRSTDILFARQGVLRRLRTFYEGSGGILIGGGFGFGRLQDHRLQLFDPQRVPAFSSVTGVVQTPGGETWLMGKPGIAHLRTAALNRGFDDPRFSVQPTILDYRDGLTGGVSRDGKRDAVRGGDGRIWFATTAGTVWVDAEHLTRNTVAPRVAISALKINGVSYRDAANLTLPMGTSMVEIDFTALSLSIPERVRFRYILEEVNRGWMDPGMRRQAFYTNLGPGTYRFRVIAANNDGVWNRDGATLEFTIPPTFLQSGWFKLLCALGIGALLWLAYSLRVQQLTARVRTRLETQLAERERIARELHDTLLQGFQGLVLRFQAVADRIPTDQPLRAIMEQALDRADAVLIEGRDRVRELRVAATSGDLTGALVHAAGEFAGDRSARFTLLVEGKPRTLHPMVRDEVQHIGEEAIRNAFRHAKASIIELVLSYRAGELRLDLRDNGVGLPADVAATGARAGHYGLPGMRERAERVGGTLAIRSGEHAGTRIQLSIPGRAAYAQRGGRWRFLRSLRRRALPQEE